MNEKQDEPLSSDAPNTEPTSSTASKAPITALTESNAADKDSIAVSAGILRTGKLPSKGELLDDRFMLVDILDSEGINITYRAIDENKPLPKKARYVTIKILKWLFQSNSDCVDALAQAAQKCQSLDHPNIAKVHGFHCNDSTVYLDMEYLPGESLEHKIRWGVKRVPAKQAVRIVNEIGHALAYAHELGVVHGDLKPANVFLTDSDEVKIIDFSIAHALRRSVQDDVGAPHLGLGKYSVVTRSYASPQLLDRKEADPRDDVYALACIAYELLAGHHPFRRVRPTGTRVHGSVLRPSAAFTRSQWSSLQKALAFERDARTYTIEEFLSSFNASAKWAHRGSIAAGVVLFCAVAGLFIHNQMSVREGLVEPEMVKSPILSEEGGSNQLVSSSKPELDTNERVGITTEAHSPSIDQTTPEQDKFLADKDNITEEITQRAEQASPPHESASPTQDETVSLTVSEPRTDIETDLSAIDQSREDTNEPMQIKPAVEAPARIQVDTATDVVAEPSSQVAESLAATSVNDVVKPTLAKQSVAVPAESESRFAL